MTDNRIEMDNFRSWESLSGEDGRETMLPGYELDDIVGFKLAMEASILSDNIHTKNFEERNMENSKHVPATQVTCKLHWDFGENYQKYIEILHASATQLCSGKGDERHSESVTQDIEDQDTLAIARALGTDLGLDQQIFKKIKESNRMSGNTKLRELYGALNYVALKIYYHTHINKSKDFEEIRKDLSSINTSEEAENQARHPVFGVPFLSP